ncbi:hypothetical protein PVAP13_3NG147901 [Panicum virgatum]|uniref:Uncharacterized protein n=1 Tax=Panicum virgatum TaxID=38727 RepID=A0A8T0UHY7_PANVG|nr:hypothetical protein PVAP13_3NG147901 [Panicum virgatum]
MTNLPFALKVTRKAATLSLTSPSGGRYSSPAPDRAPPGASPAPPLSASLQPRARASNSKHCAPRRRHSARRPLGYGARTGRPSGARPGRADLGPRARGSELDTAMAESRPAVLASFFRVKCTPCSR